MENNRSEPPGRPAASKLAHSLPRRIGALSLHQTVPVPATPPLMREAPAFARPAFASVDAMVHELRPAEPVYCLRPATIAATARRFVKAFPGDVLYAVKTNPDPRVLAWLAAAGIRHFDVASAAEIKLAADAAPEARLYFMHPVKSREAIATAYRDYGIRDFSLDTPEELAKILEVTGHAEDLNLYVRLSIPNDTAAYSLAGKFGVAPEQAASLLLATRQAAHKLGVCFHVGSQCMNPEAYTHAVAMVADLLAQAGIRLDMLDIGGGFPSIYPGLMPPPLAHYMRTIKKSLKAHPALADCRISCEPGRALVAEGGSTVARVELRKGNALYLNEGVYGSLFDAGSPGFVFPVKGMRTGGGLSDKLAEFSFFGPTCDSLDAMKGPFHLPEDIAEGDWIEIGQLGSYGVTMRTDFNGFRSDTLVEVADKPLLSMTGVN